MTRDFAREKTGDLMAPPAPVTAPPFSPAMRMGMMVCTKAIAMTVSVTFAGAGASGKSYRLEICIIQLNIERKIREKAMKIGN